MFTLSKSPIVYVQRKSKSEPFPVTLEGVKLFLRVENNQDDDLILSLIAMATEYAEWHMEKSLMKQTWQVSYEGYIPHRIYLSYGPIKEIISATAITSTNKEKQEIKYYFSNIGSYVEFQSSPNTKMVDVTYEAGYDIVPEQIKLGIIKHVSALYKNRESDIGSYLSEIKKVYLPFRNPRVIL